MLKITKKQSKVYALIFSFSLLPGCAAVVAGTAATSVLVAQDKRTAGTIVEDKSIQLKALQNIHDIIKGDPAVNVSVICYNTQVLLVGQVPSKKIRSQIEQAAHKVDKVNKVHNEMTVNAPISALTRSSDSWVTTKIKSEMALTKDINPHHVKVITEDGIVYLLGILNEEEAEIAVDIARHTKGVKKVVKIFEYH